MNLEIIPPAQNDIAETAQYYKNQRLGLDDDFLFGNRCRGDKGRGKSSWF